MKRYLIALLSFSFVAGCLVVDENEQRFSPPSETAPTLSAQVPAPEPPVTPQDQAAPPELFPQMANPLVGTMATNYPPVVAEAYAQVDLKDGVDGDEAAILAEAYFMGYVTGNGMIGEVSDRGDVWEFETFVEYSRTPYNPIQIVKKTGRIICGGGPMVNPPPGPQG